MTENAETLSTELIEHIQSCPACARAAKAMQIVDDLMDSSKVVEAPVSFDDIRQEVISRAASQTKLEKIMRNIKDQYKTRPKLITGLGFAVAALLFVTLVPLSFDQTIGYNVALSCVDSENAIQEEVLETTLAVTGYDEVDIEVVELADTVNLYINNVPNLALALNLAETFSQVVQAKVEPEIEPIKDKKLATLYSQAVDLYEQARKNPSKELATYYVQVLPLNDSSEANTYQRAASLYAQASALKYRNDSDRAEPVKLSFMFEKQNIIINNRAVSDILYSKTMSDDEIEKEFTEIVSGEGIDLSEIDIEVSTDPEMTERTIKIRSIDELNMVVNEDKMVTMGINKQDIYLRTAIDTGLAAAVDSAIELNFPEMDKPVKSRGVVLKIMLDDSKD
jgi:hypothetical protein